MRAPQPRVCQGGLALIEMTFSEPVHVGLGSCVRLPPAGNHVGKRREIASRGGSLCGIQPVPLQHARVVAVHWLLHFVCDMSRAQVTGEVAQAKCTPDKRSLLQRGLLHSC